MFFPAVRSSYLLDDYLQASMVRGAYPAPRAPFDLYNFVDDASRTVLLERGMLPWWTDPRLTIRFFRPLSSMLVWAEHTLFGDGALLLHLHSLLWWAAAVLGARALFRRVVSPRAAGIATFVFALAPCHALPIAWLANREALVSLAFGAPALCAYLSFRERGSIGSALLSAVLFALAMSGGEYALCLTGYIVAIELLAPAGQRGDAPSPLRRTLAVLPFALPAGAYLAVRRTLGYGTLGSGFYTDPLRDPIDFLRTAPRRLGVLLLDAWCGLDHETMNSDAPTITVALAFVALVLGLYVLLPQTFARLEAERRRAASWLLLGSLLALGPVLAVVPSPRLCGASMLGVAPVAALVLERFWWPSAPAGDAPSPGRLVEIAGTLALALGFAQLVHGPATAWLVGRHFAGTARDFAAHAHELRATLDDPLAAEVGVVRGMGGSFFAAFALDASRAPPHRWRILAQGGHVLALRQDARTVEVIAPVGRAIFPAGSENLYRSEHTRMAVGDEIDVQGMHVTVLDMGPRGPRRVRYRFASDLDAEPFVWITENRVGAFLPASMPKEGFGAPFDP